MMTIEKLKNSSLSEIVSQLKMMKKFKFLTKESTIFWLFLAFYNIPTFITFLISGFTEATNLAATISFVSYIFVYKLFVSKVIPNREKLNKSICEYIDILEMVKSEKENE